MKQQPEQADITPELLQDMIKEISTRPNCELSHNEICNMIDPECQFPFLRSGEKLPDDQQKPPH